MKTKTAVLAVMFATTAAGAQNTLQTLAEYEKSRTLAAFAQQLLLAEEAREMPGVPREDVLRIDDFTRRLITERRQLRDSGVGDFPVDTIAHGVHSALFPTVGALLHNGETICSGTLVTRQSFLTAKHCFHGGDEPGNYAVYLQHAGIFELDGVLVPPIDDLDVAIGRLQQGVAGISKAPTSDLLTAAGELLQVVGFGITEEAAVDSGVKRRGGILTKECPNDADQFVCWQFNPPYDPFGTNANICSRDSGGPVGAALNESLLRVHGVAVRVPEIFQCHVSSLSWSVAVSPVSEWIAETALLDGPDTDTVLPVCCGDGVEVLAEEDVIPTGAGFDVIGYEFEVPGNTRELRIGLNAADTPMSDLDLIVQPDVSSADSCKDLGRYVFCRFHFTDAPPGDWSVAVKHVGGGSTVYQLVVTMFGGAGDS